MPNKRIFNDDQFEELKKLYELGYSFEDLKKKYNCKSTDPIRNLFKKFKYTSRTRKEIQLNKIKMKPDTSKGAVGAKNRNWKGGVKIEKNKYKLIWAPNHPNAVNNYVREHILVMEESIGRYLTDDEVVHHVDENTFNNDISNLKLMTFSEHSSLHAKIAKRDNAGKFTK